MIKNFSFYQDVLEQAIADLEAQNGGISWWTEKPKGKEQTPLDLLKEFAEKISRIKLS